MSPEFVIVFEDSGGYFFQTTLSESGFRGLAPLTEI